ncbi:hypothetical protein A3850_003540 [Lewinella sp. 4G2]|nr:hypothetical protein A3850_003540 [Lewinella sp. 4G2]
MLLVFLGGMVTAQPAPTTAGELLLDHRIQLSVDRLTDLDRQPAFSRDFLLADVRLKPEDPRRFYNFSGDLSGRYLEVMSLVPEQQRGTVDLRELVTGIIAEQKADGRFGDASLSFTDGEIGGEHMALLWGNGRLLVGLMTYYEAHGDERALAAARRLGDFFISTAAACRQPAVVEQLKSFGAKGIICFTQYIEGLAMLAKVSDDDKYRRAAEANYDVLPPRGKQHSHGYLSTLRGVLLLHELTGERGQLDYVRGLFNDLLASDDHTRYGAVFEYFGGKEDASDAGNAGERDEGCSSADFVRLALHLYQLTGEATYRAAGLDAIHNALLYNQYASGDFGHHYFDDGVLRASNPRRSWWCCTMHGLRALIALKEDFSLSKEGQTHTLEHLMPQRLTGAGYAFQVELVKTDMERATYVLTVSEWPADKLLRVRQPTWGTDWSGLDIGQPEIGRAYLIQGKPGVHLYDKSDELMMTYPATPRAGYLRYGPYVLGINQGSFVAEPDWSNQIDLTTLRATPSVPFGLTADFRHGGYPGIHSVNLVPMANQLEKGHPYMRLVTGYTTEVVPVSPDR